MGVTRFHSCLYGASPLDPLTFAAIPALPLLAAYCPAERGAVTSTETRFESTTRPVSR